MEVEGLTAGRSPVSIGSSDAGVLGLALEGFLTSLDLGYDLGITGHSAAGGMCWTTSCLTVVVSEVGGLEDC